jgi:uncharacterized protein YprB with RNaseH-like and TPR domain
MEDVQLQLAALRRRVAQIDRKYAAPAASPRRAVQRPTRHVIEDLLTGEVVRTAHGAHFETERVWERHRRHGSVDISDLAGLPGDLLHPLSAGTIPAAPPTRWAFLDTETTGLAAGSCAFLIGVGSIDSTGFRLRQFFLRDYADEPSLLARLSEYLAQFDVLITYNGKSFDQPLLEGRYRMVRAPHPFHRLPHLDLLFGARRLWKLRLDSCRLVDLENQILGVEREGDLPGEMIPYCYLEFLRTRQAFQLVPIFHHNALDILSLACLTAIVPFAFRSPDNTQVHHGADLIGLARWLSETDRHEESLALFHRALAMGLPDHLLFRTQWDIAALERRAGRADASLALLTDLAAVRNPYRVRALAELAKHYEHHERSYSMALEMTRAALSLEESPELRRREERLQTRLARRPAGPNHARAARGNRSAARRVHTDRA